MALHLVVGLARRRSTEVTWPQANGTSGIRPQEVVHYVRRKLGAHLL
jgi:hypothetical protein